MNKVSVHMELLEFTARIARHGKCHSNMVAAGCSVDRPLGNLERYVTMPQEALPKILNVTG